MDDLLRNYAWVPAYLESLKVKQDLAEIRRKLAECSPVEYFQFKAGEVVEDRRRAFVERWRDLQREFRAPVSPSGHSLEFSSEAEKEAYEVLGLRKHINVYGFDPLMPRKEGT